MWSNSLIEQFTVATEPIQLIVWGAFLLGIAVSARRVTAKGFWARISAPARDLSNAPSPAAGLSASHSLQG